MREIKLALALCVTLLWSSTALAQAPRYIDNGDGTISDTMTGLMWEKKTGTVGDSANPNDVHDVNNLYTWSNSSNIPLSPNGTAFTKFLGTLNGAEVFPSFEHNAGCFALHCDWRLPQINELKGIVDTSQGAPPIDPIFGPTQIGFYWSATSHSGIPILAWGVGFKINGGAVGGVKYNVDGYYVRAVRSGL